MEPQVNQLHRINCSTPRKLRYLHLIEEDPNGKNTLLFMQKIKKDKI